MIVDIYFGIQMFEIIWSRQRMNYIAFRKCNQMDFFSFMEMSWFEIGMVLQVPGSPFIETPGWIFEGNR